MMGNYRKHLAENKLKVTYSNLSNALQIINNEYNLAFTPEEVISTTDWSRELSKNVFEHYIAKHLQIVQRIPLNRSNFISYNDKGEGGFSYGNSYCVILSNGTGLCMTQQPTAGNMYFYIVLNPSKSKLVAGKDIFFFAVERDIPNGNYNMNLNMGNIISKNYSSTNRNQYIKNCISSTPYPQYAFLRDAFCTYLIFENNWKIPKDYPIKF